MDVGWGILEACVLFTNEGFNVARHLVIHLLKLRFEALCCQVGINQPVCPQGSSFDWLLMGTDLTKLAL